MLWAREHCNPLRLGEPLFEQLDALAHELYGQVAHAGKITAGSCPALHKLDVERIPAEAEHYGFLGLAEGQHREFLCDDDLGIGCQEIERRRIHIV